MHPIEALYADINLRNEVELRFLDAWDDGLEIHNMGHFADPEEKANADAAVMHYSRWLDEWRYGLPAGDDIPF